MKSDSDASSSSAVAGGSGGSREGVHERTSEAATTTAAEARALARQPFQLEVNKQRDSVQMLWELLSGKKEKRLDTAQKRTLERRKVPDEAQDVILHFDDPERLESRLERELVKGRDKLFGVFGMPGVGKTSICIALSKREAVKTRFEFVAWFSIGPRANQKHVVEYIRDLLNILDTSRETVITAESGMPTVRTLHALLKRLRNLLNNRQILVVLDDVWELHHLYYLLEAVQMARGKNAVIISSRFQNIADTKKYRLVRSLVTELSEEDAIAVLKRRRGKESLVTKGEKMEIDTETRGNVDEEKAKELLGMVGRLPLLVSTVGGMMAAGQMEWDELLKELKLARDNSFQQSISLGETNPEDYMASGESVSMVAEVGLAWLRREYCVETEDAKSLYRNYTRLSVLPNNAWVDLDSLALLWRKEGMETPIEEEIKVLATLNFLSVVKEEEGLGSRIIVTVHDSFLSYLRIRERENMSRYHSEILQRLVDVTAGEFRPTDASGRTRMRALIDGRTGNSYRYMAENSTWHVFYALDELMQDEPHRTLAEEVIDLRDSSGCNVLYFGTVYPNRAAEMDKAVECGMFGKINQLEGDRKLRFMMHHEAGFTPLHAFCLVQNSKSIGALFEYVTSLTTPELSKTMGPFTGGAPAPPTKAAMWLMQVDDVNGMNALNYCVTERGQEVVEKVLDMGKESLSKQEFGRWLMHSDKALGVSALHCCCSAHGEGVMMKLLGIAREALSNDEMEGWLTGSDEYNGLNALHWCILWQCEEVVEKVLDMGRKILSEEKFGNWLMGLSKHLGMNALQICFLTRGCDDPKNMLDAGKELLSPGDYLLWVMQLEKTSGWRLDGYLHGRCFSLGELIKRRGRMVKTILHMGREVLSNDDFSRWLMQHCNSLRRMSAINLCFVQNCVNTGSELMRMAEENLPNDLFRKWLMMALNEQYGKNDPNYFYPVGESLRCDSSFLEMMEAGSRVLTSKEFVAWLIEPNRVNGENILLSWCGGPPCYFSPRKWSQSVSRLIDLGKEFLSNEEFPRWLTALNPENGMSALHYCCGKKSMNADVLTKLLVTGKEVLSNEDFVSWLMQLDGKKGRSALFLSWKMQKESELIMLMDVGREAMSNENFGRWLTESGGTGRVNLLHLCCGSREYDMAVSWCRAKQVRKKLLKLTREGASRDKFEGLVIKCRQNGDVYGARSANLLKKLLDVGKEVLSNDEFRRWLMSPDGEGEGALHYCCMRSRSNQVTILIEKGREVLSDEEFSRWLMELDGKNGWSALHYCCMGAQSDDTVKKMMDMGREAMSNEDFGRWLTESDIVNGMSPLHLWCGAFYISHPQKSSLVFTDCDSYGSNIVVQSELPAIMLDMGRAVLSNEEFGRWLMELDKQCGRSPLHYLCRRKKQERASSDVLMGKMLDMGREVLSNEEFGRLLTEPDNEGKSVLLYCHAQTEEVAKKVLDMGREVLSNEEFGRFLTKADAADASALHYFFRGQSEEVAQKVLDMGRELLSNEDFGRWLTHSDKAGLTALHCCYQAMGEEGLQKLLDMGREVLSKEELGRWLTGSDEAKGVNVLLFHSYFPRAEQLKKVIELGRECLSDEDFGKWLISHSESGHNALQVCCRSQSSELVEAAMNMGREVLSKEDFKGWLILLDFDGKGALHSCCENNGEEAVTKMLEMGREVMSRDEFQQWLMSRKSDGWSALHSCCLNRGAAAAAVVRKGLDMGRKHLSRDEFRRWLTMSSIDNENVLHACCRSGSDESLKVVLDAGREVLSDEEFRQWLKHQNSSRDAFGENFTNQGSVLHFSCWMPGEEVLTRVLRIGREALSKEEFGKWLTAGDECAKSVLHYCCAGENTKRVEALKKLKKVLRVGREALSNEEFGKWLTAAENEGYSALFGCWWEKKNEMVNVLVEMGREVLSEEHLEKWLEEIRDGT